jgi:hypothetical protein
MRIWGISNPGIWDMNCWYISSFFFAADPAFMKWIITLRLEG